MRPAAIASERAARVLACSIYEQLRSEGCSTRDMISVSSQLLSLVTAKIKNGERSSAE